MIKRLCLALAGLFALASIAQGAGTVPGFSLTPQFDLSGHVAPGCKLYIIQAGTTSTPQNAYQDSGLTLLQPNPMTCDAAGRLGQFFLADGVIKLRLTDRNGVQLFVGDNLTVVGASGGGGGGGTVDPTTILATGDFKLVYNTGIVTGFVRCNGRTIGSATSGATERANADTTALFAFLWGADANLAVSGGRGANAAADYAANKTIALPDCRGRAFAGLSDMGSSDSGRISTTYFGCTGLVLGCAGGSESTTLTVGQLPAGITSRNAAQAISVNLTQNVIYGGSASSAQGGGSQTTITGGLFGTFTAAGANDISVTSNNTLGQAHRTVQPTILVTTYIKL